MQVNRLLAFIQVTTIAVACICMVQPSFSQSPPAFVLPDDDDATVQKGTQAAWLSFLQAATEGDTGKALTHIRLNTQFAQHFRKVTPDALRRIAAAYVDIGLSWRNKYVASCHVVARKEDGTYVAYPVLFVHTEVGWLIENF